MAVSPVLLLRRLAPVAALLLLYAYSSVLGNRSRASIRPSLVPAHAQEQSTAQVPIAAFRAAAPPPARPSYRDFCNASAEDESPNRPLSQFTERTSAALRAAAVAAAGGDAAAKAALQALLAPIAAKAKCHWTRYVIPNYADPPEAYPICTHDPRVDASISAALHKYQAWFSSYVYQDLVGVMVDGTCPPDRPVILDLGLNIGSFAMYGLQLGCHVIGFDGLSANMNRVVQTATRAVGKDGKPFIARFHGFVNAVGNHVGDVTMAFNPTNPGASNVADRAWAVQVDVAETVHAVLLDDLLFELPEAHRPKINVGMHNDAGKWNYALQPLLPQHVYIVKIDVETFEFVTVHGMRRLLEGAIRPAGLFIEMALDKARGTGCDVLEFTRFMYGLGYVYVPSDGGQKVEVEEGDMLADIQHRLECVECLHILEGWWLLRR